MTVSIILIKPRAAPTSTTAFKNLVALFSLLGIASAIISSVLFIASSLSATLSAYSKIKDRGVYVKLPPPAPKRFPQSKKAAGSWHSQPPPALHPRTALPQSKKNGWQLAQPTSTRPAFSPDITPQHPRTAFPQSKKKRLAVGTANLHPLRILAQRFSKSILGVPPIFWTVN